MVKVYIAKSGTKWWSLNGKRHRVNGPSIVQPNGVRWWFWNDLGITEFEHMMLMAQEQANG